MHYIRIRIYLSLRILFESICVMYVCYKYVPSGEREFVDGLIFSQPVSLPIIK